MLRFACGFMLVISACGPTTTGGGAGAGGSHLPPDSGGTGASGGSGGTGGVGGIDPMPDAMECGVQTFMPRPNLPPDLLIVLDRSFSMTDPPAAGGASKWMQVTMAIDSVLGDPGLPGSIKW